MANAANASPGVDELRRAVIDLEPRDPREERSRLEILDALDELPAPFDERSSARHVTASAVVVGRRGTVLHRHKRLGRWMQPGGHIEPGEDAPSAARREAGEETGLDLRHPADGPALVHVDVHPAAKGHVHLDVRYLLLGPDLDPAPGPGESPDVAWFGWEQARALADDALVGALTAAEHHPETARLLAAASGGRER